jgi:hypothetical protein
VISMPIGPARDQFGDLTSAREVSRGQMKHEIHPIRPVLVGHRCIGHLFYVCAASLLKARWNTPQSPRSRCRGSKLQTLAVSEAST